MHYYSFYFTEFGIFQFYRIILQNRILVIEYDHKSLKIHMNLKIINYILNFLNKIKLVITAMLNLYKFIIFIAEMTEFWYFWILQNYCTEKRDNRKIKTQIIRNIIDEKVWIYKRDITVPNIGIITDVIFTIKFGHLSESACQVKKWFFSSNIGFHQTVFFKDSSKHGVVFYGLFLFGIKLQ